MRERERRGYKAKWESAICPIELIRKEIQESCALVEQEREREEEPFSGSVFGGVR